MAPDHEFQRRVGVALAFSGGRPRPRLLKYFGWFAVLTVVAAVLGTALRFVA